MARADNPRPTVAIPATFTADNGVLLAVPLDVLEEYRRKYGDCSPETRLGWGLPKARHETKGSRFIEDGREKIETKAVAIAKIGL